MTMASSIIAKSAEGCSKSGLSENSEITSKKSVKSVDVASGSTFKRFRFGTKQTSSLLAKETQSCRVQEACQKAWTKEVALREIRRAKSYWIVQRQRNDRWGFKSKGDGI